MKSWLFIKNVTDAEFSGQVQTIKRLIVLLFQWPPQTEMHKKCLDQTPFLLLAKECLRPGTSLKKRLQHRSFPAHFVKFLKAPSFVGQLWWLAAYDLRPLYFNVTYFWELSQFIQIAKFRWRSNKMFAFILHALIEICTNLHGF